MSNGVRHCSCQLNKCRSAKNIDIKGIRKYMSTHIINHVLNRLITSGDQKINMYATFVLVSVVLTGACCTTQIQLKFYLFKKRKEYGRM